MHRSRPVGWVGIRRRFGRRRALLAIVGASAAMVLLSPSVQAATPGWAGETIISSTATGDGWEPAIAADPSAPYVYTGWMQYVGTKSIIWIRVSADGGATWGTAHALTPSNQSQFDIVLATTSAGAVYATYMQGNHVQFTRSTNHGSTWSSPIQVSGGTWADKPWLAASGSGTDAYITWTTRGNLFAVSSHTAGASWSSPLQVTNESNVYYYSNGGTVLPNGTAEMVGSEYPENGNNTKNTGPVPIVAFRTTNGGTSWTRTVVDTLNTGARFATSSVTTIASDANGTLVLVYSGSLAVGANGKVYIRRSTDSGATWGARTELTTSAGGADATSVAAAGRGNGLFTVTWMDARTGAWNVWQRGSIDGGQTWAADAKASDATSGATYKTANGFGFPYGDYDTVAFNSAGKTVAVMGEGDTSQLHGDIWVNRQT
jgi:hypothetical protein